MDKNHQLILMHTDPYRWLRKDLADRLGDIYRQVRKDTCGPSQTSRNRRTAVCTTLKEAISCLTSMEKENARLRDRNRLLRMEALKLKR